MIVQSVLFSKNLWGENGARAWLITNGYRSGKIHETKNTLRFRQIDPTIFARYKIVQSGSPGVQLVVPY